MGYRFYRRIDDAQKIREKNEVTNTLDKVNEKESLGVHHTAIDYFVLKLEEENPIEFDELRNMCKDYIAHPISNRKSFVKYLNKIGLY